jgi:hypothetical protein
MVRFVVADMTRRLPFTDGGFDAFMSNVAMHMFPDGVTRAVFAEVGRRLVHPLAEQLDRLRRPTD